VELQYTNLVRGIDEDAEAFVVQAVAATVCTEQGRLIAKMVCGAARAEAQTHEHAPEPAPTSGTRPREHHTFPSMLQGTVGVSMLHPPDSITMHRPAPYACVRACSRTRARDFSQ